MTRRSQVIAAAAGAALAFGSIGAAGKAASPRAAAPASSQVSGDLDGLRAGALAAIAKARPRAAAGSPLVREVSLPSIERLVEDADLRRANVTVADRDLGFARRNLGLARDFAEQMASGGDPYRTATGLVVKAYRADWDGTLQPYALYVPPAYKPGRPGGWPLIIALHGAFSDYRHNLRRAFGLDNRPGETDVEASRNELPFPDVAALVVSPSGRGELMGYDGLGGDDVMRVLADVRRAYDVDPDRISLTGLSMGGGGTWQIGLRHPELFAAIAPVCGVTDLRKWMAADERDFYDDAALDALLPLALATNAAHLQVFIFHGGSDTVVPVTDSRRMVERYRTLGWLNKNVHYTEYPGVGHEAWHYAYKDAELLRKLAAIKRDPAAPKVPAPPPPPGQAVPGLFGKSVPRQHPHLYVYGTNGSPAAVAAARELALQLADWGPMVSAKFAVKADREVTAAERARFNLVVVGATPLNSFAAGLPIREVAGLGGPLGDRAFRAVVADPKAPSGYALVLGALTPRGFAGLGRFARPNRDAWAPEPNKSFLLLPAD